MPTRIDSIKNILNHNHVDAALISKKETLYYLTGLIPHHPTEREAYLLINNQHALLYHSPFVAVPSTVPTLTMSSENPMRTVFSNFFTPTKTIGIEKTNMAVAEYERLQTYMPQKQYQAIDEEIARMRIIKDDSEIKYLQKAGTIASEVVRWCQKKLNHPSSLGLTETAVAHQIEHKLRQLGGDDTAFPTIVAFDEHAALPHHMPGQKKLTLTSVILIDMGVSVHQYKSDITRTWQRGSHPPDKTFQHIKSIVHSAYDNAVKAATVDTPAMTIDKAARSSINAAGYANAFVHTTGHGIGLEAHELPHINATDSTPVTPGTVFTIEPGIYLQGKFGYRHENTFFMTNTGAISLTD